MQPIEQVIDSINEGRRLKIAYVSPEMVLQVFGRRPKVEHDKGSSWVLYHLEGLPDDARVVGVNYDHLRRAFAIAVEHADFDVVPMAEHCPELLLTVGITEVPVIQVASYRVTETPT